MPIFTLELIKCFNTLLRDTCGLSVRERDKMADSHGHQTDPQSNKIFKIFTKNKDGNSNI